MGRPRKYFTPEEEKQAYRNGYKKWYYTHKWYCDVCDKELCMSSKYSHPKSKAHLDKEKTYKKKNGELSINEVQD